MSDAGENLGHTAKKRKTSHDATTQNDTSPDGGMTPLASLSRPVTPPFTRQTPQVETKQRRTSTQLSSNDGYTIIPSPIQLTHIPGLSNSSGNNIDTIKLPDILGDPMISECWQFNFCFDVDFIMDQFDTDVKNIVQVKVVHGSWKKDSPNRIRIEVGTCPNSRCHHEEYRQTKIISLKHRYRNNALATRTSSRFAPTCRNLSGLIIPR